MNPVKVKYFGISAFKNSVDILNEWFKKNPNIFVINTHISKNLDGSCVYIFYREFYSD